MNSVQERNSTLREQSNSRSPGAMRFFAWFYKNIIKTCKLPKVHDSQAELRRLAFLRIGIALALFVRTALSTYASFYYYEPSTFFGVTANFQFIASVMVLSLVLCLAIGFLTPISCLLLLLASAAAQCYSCCMEFIMKGLVGRHYKL